MRSRLLIVLLLALSAIHCGTTGRGGDALAGGTTTGGGNTVTYAAGACVGSTPLLRLSQAQYVTSVQDMFGVTLPALDLPQDDQAGPFAANYATSVTDLGVSQYQAAALTVAGVMAGQLAQVLPCDPNAMTTECAANLVSQLGKKAFRRPLTVAEQTQLNALVSTYAQVGDANGTVRLLTQALLQSPWFLYRIETGAPTTDPNVRSLTGYELATRMAYLLWGSTPDDALMATADDNSLLDPTVLAQEANRLLDDPHFSAQMTLFFQQLLALDGWTQITKDPNLYPSYNDNLEAAMVHETGDFIKYVMTQDDARLETVLTAPYSIVTSPLAALYNVSMSPDANTPVTFDPTQRAGLLTQAAFLTVHAHGNGQPAVVLRGKVVRENLLCQAMPAPPPNVLPLPDVTAPDATAREIFASHESNASCAACHQLMDPIGLSFETFDGIGTYRTHQGNAIIDPSGDITGTAHTNTNFADVVALSHVLALSDDVHTCVVSQALRFGLSRQLGTADNCSVAALGAAFDAGSHNMRDLMFQIVTSPEFRSLGVGP